MPYICISIKFQPVIGHKIEFYCTKYVIFVGIYACPCYYYPNRSGVASRASFVVAADLRSGQMSADHWIKRGTALLMSLDH